MINHQLYYTILYYDTLFTSAQKSSPSQLPKTAPRSSQANPTELRAVTLDSRGTEDDYIIKICYLYNIYHLLYHRIWLYH